MTKIYNQYGLELDGLDDLILKVKKLGSLSRGTYKEGDTFYFFNPKLQLMADYFGDCESVDDIIDNMKEYDEMFDDEDLGYWRRILGGVKYPKDEKTDVIPKEFFVEESK